MVYTTISIIQQLQQKIIILLLYWVIVSIELVVVWIFIGAVSAIRTLKKR